MLKHVFIPCAGMGSRMGEIGQELPKPLWPLYEVSFLEFLYIFLEKQGFENFFINTHHQAFMIDELIKRKSLEIETLYEKELLGSGGAIHNLKKHHPELKDVLIHNSDIMLICDKPLTELSPSRLICMEVEAHSNYNSLSIKNNKLEEIGKGLKDHSFTTFSGISALNISTLPHVDGFSNFFETVFPLKEKPLCELVSNPYEYWDFGTLDLYYFHCWKLFFSETQVGLKKRLIDLGFFKPKKVGDLSYGTDQRGVLNFSSNPLKKEYPFGSIVFNEDLIWVISPEMITPVYREIPQLLVQ